VVIAKVDESLSSKLVDSATGDDLDEIGKLFGPIIGALFLHWMEDTFFGTNPGAWNVLLGAVFVFFVLFARSGIVGVFRTALRRAADRFDRGGGGGDDVAMSGATESDD
jgi:hypothetical protein